MNCLSLQPINFDEACAFIAEHHSHHMPPQGWKFGMAVNNGKKVVGVIVIGRPVARRADDGYTLEVTRCCTDGTKNAASMLYGAAWRAVRAMGYRKLITFTLNSEAGTSLIAAGWKVVGQTSGKSWSVPSRPRIDKHPLQGRLKWEAESGRKQLKKIKSEERGYDETLKPGKRTGNTGNAGIEGVRRGRRGNTV